MITRSGKKNAMGNRPSYAYALLTPALVYLAVLMLYPLLWSIVMGFTDKRTGVEVHFVWFQNYVKLFSDPEYYPIFYKTIKNTMIYTVCAVAFKVVFGMIMALVLNSSVLKFRNMFRSLLFLPWALPTLVSVFTWKWILSDIGGALNYILQKLSLINEQIGWFSTPQLAMFSVILINVWRGIPFLGISILAGLQTISGDMYEAAQIDGANAWRKFWAITLPSVKNVVLLASVITSIWTLNDFEIIWLLTRGGPDNGTQVFSTLAYTYGFLNRELGLSIAISVISLPILILLVGIAAKQSMSDAVE